MNNKLDNIKSLLDLSLGEKARILKVNGCTEIIDRIYSFGLVKDVEIELIKETPFHSPRVYKLLNTTVALRTGIAKKIEVTIINNEEK